MKPVRELFGVMAAEQIAQGYFVTAGVFTSEDVAHHGDWRAAEVTQAINSEERTRMRPRTLRDHLAPFSRADNRGKERAENPYR